MVAKHKLTIKSLLRKSVHLPYPQYIAVFQRFCGPKWGICLPFEVTLSIYVHVYKSKNNVLQITQFYQCYRHLEFYEYFCELLVLKIFLLGESSEGYATPLSTIPCGALV